MALRPSDIMGGSPASKEVLDATFVTHVLPDISPAAGVIGICTVPSDRAGADDLGWNIADFLAFKALLRGEGHPKSQVWLAQCDVVGIVNAHPEQYAHGMDRRLVSSAAAASSFTDRHGGTQQREGSIKVDSSATGLKALFLSTLIRMSDGARKMKCPLVIIVCGPTTLEQDVYFGNINVEDRVTSVLMRKLLGEDINVTMVTPALFSAGWLVNPSFCRSPVAGVRADRTDFLAKQFAGMFARDTVDHFIGWDSPLLSRSGYKESQKSRRAFPGPVEPSKQQSEASDELKSAIYKILIGQVSIGYDDHSYRFETHNDDWEKLIGAREHKPLAYYKKKWESLETCAADTNNQPFDFLGNAFGGNQASQAKHIKQLVKMALQGWPGHWKSFYGRAAKLALENFLEEPSPPSIDCHEVFVFMEHHATSATLADMIVKYFNLTLPYKERSKDWDAPKWDEEISDYVGFIGSGPFRKIGLHIPATNLPPGVNRNPLSLIQTDLQSAEHYVSASLCLQYVGRTRELEKDMRTATKHICNFLEAIRDRQIKLLIENLEVESKGAAWLSSIGAPVRPLSGATTEVASHEDEAHTIGNLVIRLAADVPGRGEGTIVEESDESSPEHSDKPLDPEPVEAEATPADDGRTTVSADLLEMIPHIDHKVVMEHLREVERQLASSPDGSQSALKLNEIKQIKLLLEQEMGNRRSTESNASQEAPQASPPASDQNSSGGEPSKPKAQYIPPHLRRPSQ
ncbi:uncharacterized protein F4822DRAFT_441343 [Hypoxylon trugodes]|uniref:uncharacterized protein n=1 Tax=Hypoxylon trugodes TaxID=326681 RepID=UPI002196908C|nr:uncharacterized protein F4822DRAFT_441343 [Hypoxylon trugodes]KAI1392309.1 hypothetical protein F4822DRAFT_441343 [Hypoxylon trugodes]